MSAEIYLEHAKDKNHKIDQSTHFFDIDPETGKGSEDKENAGVFGIHEDHVFFFDLTKHDGLTQPDINGLNMMVIYFNQSEDKKEIQPRRQEKVQFFDIPECVNDLNSCKEKNRFLGYCLDSGAARSVVGKAQYQALCKTIGHRLKVRSSPTNFKFGKSNFKSLCKFIPD